MKGLELSKAYFEAVVKPKLQADFPELYPHLAAGLVGNGSDCFGYDDEISQDHDWGVEYFIWIPNDRLWEGKALQDWRMELFRLLPPAAVRNPTAYGAKIGVQTCDEFYRSLIGYPEGPKALTDWLRIPEENLAMAVNGEVFMDNEGRFTQTREKLLRHYPEDIRRKKLAAKAMAIAQTGQYNHRRMAKREDWVTVRAALCRFAEAAMGMCYLLNRRYKPYYKWAWRGLRELPNGGNALSEALMKLTLVPGFSEQDFRCMDDYIEQACSVLRNELRRQNLTRNDDWFFATHGEELMSGIQDDFIRSLPATYE